MKKSLSALGAALVVGAWVGIAQAHTHLKKTVPAAGSTVAATLSEI